MPNPSGGSTSGVSSVTSPLGTIAVSPTTGAVQEDLANPLPAGTLAVQGTGAGGTVFASAEAGAGSHTQTFPAKTGTVADISDIPSASGTVDGPDNFGDSSSPGSGTSYSLGNHKHGLPNSGVIYAPVTLKSSGSPYSVASGDEVIIVTTGASGYIVNLPAASTAGRKLIIIKGDSGAGAVTVTPAGSDTIEGAASKSIPGQYGKVGIVSDGVSVWYDLGSGGV